LRFNPLLRERVATELTDSMPAHQFQSHLGRWAGCKGLFSAPEWWIRIDEFEH
jgi:hypothetical protein